ncbi:FmdB family zinc ribbon protein [Lentzea cavernae]|uniref:FmdB family zinc ribbon protein n=1 Tax=Lentzea cavernae TaxID=2020703 RepID=UPI00174E44AB|nr:FmdB family zinc ribbon protein [Lentzea cavernae]
MPTYQYACTACEHRFEAVQSFSDASLTECPECSGKLRKLFGAVGVVFKGSGFYRTDSRSGSSSASASTTSTPEKKSSDTKSTSTSSSSSSSSSSDSSKSSKSAPAAAAS